MMETCIKSIVFYMQIMYNIYIRGRGVEKGENL